ncbi:recombinase family protein [Kribbella sp. NPDC006257]|uniref:recombinase family protein n=1 Tax=Kribbella sp. NPDC006257 TaxID=3156738 RepID=UPI0033B65C4B
MTTPTRRTATLYARLSREAGDTNLSLAGMIAELRQAAEAAGCVVVGEHVDNGKSGAIRDRPEFVAWLGDAVSGRANELWASHTDRLTREGVNAAARVLDVVEGKDPETGAVVRPPVRLITADGLDSERDAEAFRWRFVIAAEVARAERARIAARNKATQRRLAEAGRYTGSPVPFGWQVVPGPDGGKVLAVKPEEAAIVRDLAARWAAGESMRSLTQWLNASGHRTRPKRRKGSDVPTAGEWTVTSVRRVLATAATKELLTDRALRRAVEDRLNPASDKPKPTGGRPVKYLLSGGLAYCAGCKTAMTTSAGRYVCNALRTGYTCDVSATATATMLDAHAAERWLGALGDVERTRTVPASDAADTELDDVLDEIATVGKAFATASAAEVAGLAKRMTRLRKREAELVNRDRSGDFHVIQSTGQTWGQAWEVAGDNENRRALLRETGFRVYVGKAASKGDRNIAGRCRVVWL